MTSSMEKIVQATASSLGYLENGVYFAEPDCYATVHDLIRYLHNDNDTFDARRICLARNIVRNDLVPILTAQETNDDLFNLTLRLTANLCQPAIVAFGGKAPLADQMQVYCDLETHLVDCLKGFTGQKIFEKFATFLQKYYDKEWTNRPEGEKTIVDRIVMLMRYIFSIGMEGPISTEAPSVSPLTKERMIESFLSTEMPKALIRVGCDRMEKELSVHIMSIFSLLFRCIDCEKVSTFELIQTENERRKEEEELKETLEHEKAMIAAKQAQRSSRTFLGGNYVLKNAALDPEKELVVGRVGINSPLDVLRSRKQAKKTAKRFRIRNELESMFKPNKSAAMIVCKLMNEFCRNFINNAFDRLMKTTRETAFSSNRTGILMYSDVNYFFLCEYVLQFIRLSKMSIGKIQSVFSRDFFNHVISQTGIYFDTMVTDKHQIRTYAIRAQHAVSAYKELMQLLHSLSKAESQTDKEVFAYMTRAIYYMEEYREFGYMTLGRLKPEGMTRKLLDDLIVANHFYIAVMERLIKAGEMFKVAKRKRLIKRRKKEQAKAKEKLVEISEHAKTDQMVEDELETLWSDLLAQIDDVLNGKVEANTEISPINVLLKVDDEKHQTFAVLEIQRALRGRRVCDAVGLLHGARDLWPDSTFGSLTNSVDDDRELLHEIFGMPIADIAVDYDEATRQVYGDDAAAFDAEEMKSVSDEEEKAKVVVEEQSDDQEPKFQVAEIEFDFNEYVMRFAKPDVIHWYSFVFKDYKTNEQQLNKSTLKMFHRFAFQLNSPSRLYIATLFRTLLKLHAEVHECPAEMRRKHKHFELYEFGYHLLRKFFGHYKERGSVLICELLFSKTARDCVEIENGYGTYDEQMQKSTLTWPEELEEELRTLYQQYTDMEEKPEDITILEFIQHNLSRERTPNQITRQLKRMGLMVEKSKKKRAPRKPRQKNKLNDPDEFLVSRSPSPVNLDNERKDQRPNGRANPISADRIIDADSMDSSDEDEFDVPAKSRSPSAEKETSPFMEVTHNLSSSDEEVEELDQTVNRSKRVIDSDDEEKEVNSSQKKRTVFDDDDED
ncbi:TIMELESS domain-containing protein [Aphelenchoides besseyi]|nr:TIMELESS domain-containing protein [Aphelenchoides besseyi]